MAELPPYFYSQDLARLVLGYLEEEECMSAYTEFINSSPHLDTFRTHHNNSAISCSFKTLKDIFVEYCAFKTYTRNCNIPVLRSLLLQCKTLSDTAQLLIAHVDLKKLQNQADSQPRNSGRFPVLSQPPKRKECEVCNVIGHTERCECRGRQPVQPNLFATPFKSAPQEGAAFTNLPLETLVETTQLADLPGTSAPAKRIITSENPSQQPTAHRDDLPNQSDQRLHHAELPETRTDQVVYEQSELMGKEKAPPNTAPQSLNISVKTTDLMNCPEDLSDILNIVSRNNGTGNTCTNQATLGVEKSLSRAGDSNRRTSSVDISFHAFASGVASGNSKCATSEAMPDSSTPESNTNQAVQSLKSYHAGSANIVQSPPVMLNSVNIESRHEGSQTVPLSHEHYSVETERARDSLVSSELKTSNKQTKKCKRITQTPVCSSSTKGFEQKIKILSDNVVKTTVDSGKLVINKKGTTTTLRMLPGKPPGINTYSSLPPPNAIIHINGMTVFQNKDHLKPYTKEQILAMPTVIVNESPAADHKSSASTNNVTTTTANTTVSPALQVESGYKSLGPITVSVGSTSHHGSSDTRQFACNKEVPKETVSMEKVSTPNKPLLLKKASSTPRRNSSSHVRALDFATPRRILHVMETVPEQVSVATATIPEPNPVEQPTLGVPGVIVREVPPQGEHKRVVKNTKGGWDADLRALLPCTDSEPANEKKQKKVNMKKKCPKVSSKPKGSENPTRKTNSKDKPKNKPETLKKKKATKELEEMQEEPPARSSVVKPMINLIKDWRNEPIEPSIKINDAFVEISIPDSDTPETDVRPSTNYPPSSKHNLSDFSLLQTPLKMMLANIQMETPQSIDPAILGEPISDIKIDTIPTPNFLNTPNFLLSCGKGTGGTPSSYSSRPTDYSSGGSYYRPDELEYAPPPDLQPQPPPAPTSPPPPTPPPPPTSPPPPTPPPPPTSPPPPTPPPPPTSPPHCTTGKLEPTKAPKHKENINTISTTSRSSRPRRQCTLKVSYYNTPTPKSKSFDKSDSSRSRSPSVSVDYSPESSQQSDSSQIIIDGDKVCNEQYKNKNIKTNEDVLAELVQKRKRTIDRLNKKTPIKNSRKSGGGSSFPKVKMPKQKPQPARRPKTVAELRQSIGPRKMPNSSKKKIQKRSISKDPSESLTPLSCNPVPAKSRRKSSTPRKVNKFMAHNLDDSASVEIMVMQKPESDVMEEELPPLRISSNDGSQDASCRRVINYEEPDTDDIRQIKAYIEKSSEKTSETGVQELVQRGFDLETAKSIERDLMGTPQHDSHELSPNRSNNAEMGKIIVDVRQEVSTSSKVILTIEKESSTKTIESPPLLSTSQPAGQEMQDISNQANATKTSQENSLKSSCDIILDGDIFMVRETFDEESDNYFTCQHDDEQPIKDSVSGSVDQDFAFDVQLEEVNIKICFNKLETLYDLPPCETEEIIENVRNQLLESSSDSEDVREFEDVETVNAVESISNINPLYTPMKANHSHSSLKRQCLDIFDSTLNSLDTPMKQDYHLQSDRALTPHEDEDDAQESWEHVSSTKRQRHSGSPVGESTSKKSRPNPQIQLKNIDIQSILTKLHGEEDVKSTS